MALCGYGCGTLNNVDANVCSGCNNFLSIKKPTNDETFEIGQIIFFPRKACGLLEKGTIVKISSQKPEELIRIKYYEKSWSDDIYDEYISIDNIHSSIESATAAAPRSRKPVQHFQIDHNVPQFSKGKSKKSMSSSAINTNTSATTSSIKTLKPESSSSSSSSSSKSKDKKSNLLNGNKRVFDDTKKEVNDDDDDDDSDNYDNYYISKNKYIEVKSAIENVTTTAITSQTHVTTEQNGKNNTSIKNDTITTTTTNGTSTKPIKRPCKFAKRSSSVSTSITTSKKQFNITQDDIYEQIPSLDAKLANGTNIQRISMSNIRDESVIEHHYIYATMKEKAFQDIHINNLLLFYDIYLHYLSINRRDDITQSVCTTNATSVNTNMTAAVRASDETTSTQSVKEEKLNTTTHNRPHMHTEENLYQELMRTVTRHIYQSDIIPWSQLLTPPPSSSNNENALDLPHISLNNTQIDKDNVYIHFQYDKNDISLKKSLICYLYAWSNPELTDAQKQEIGVPTAPCFRLPKIPLDTFFDLVTHCPVSRKEIPSTASYAKYLTQLNIKAYDSSSNYDTNINFNTYNHHQQQQQQLVNIWTIDKREINNIQHDYFQTLSTSVVDKSVITESKQALFKEKMDKTVTAAAAAAAAAIGIYETVPSDEAIATSENDIILTNGSTSTTLTFTTTSSDTDLVSIHPLLQPKFTYVIDDYIYQIQQFLIGRGRYKMYHSLPSVNTTTTDSISLINILPLTDIRDITTTTIQKDNDSDTNGIDNKNDIMHEIYSELIESENNDTVIKSANVIPYNLTPIRHDYPGILNTIPPYNDLDKALSTHVVKESIRQYYSTLSSPLTLPLTYIDYQIIMDATFAIMGGREGIENDDRIGGQKVAQGVNIRTMYGGVFDNMVNEMIQRSCMTSTSRYLDIGSGIGQSCIQVAAMIGCQVSGIEVLPARYQNSKQIVNIFNYLLKVAGCDSQIKVDFYNENFMILPTIIQQHNIIFFNNYGTWFTEAVTVAGLGNMSPMLRFCDQIKECPQYSHIFVLNPLVESTCWLHLQAQYLTDKDSCNWTTQALDVYHNRILIHEWKCNSCTQMNPLSAEACITCGTVRKTQRKTRGSHLCR